MSMMSMTHEEFERALKEELTAALNEKRQPNCPNCKKPLELMYEVAQYTAWIWDKDKAKYTQTYDLGEAESDPKCGKCEFESCSFLEDMADDSELKALLTKLRLCF